MKIIKIVVYHGLHLVAGGDTCWLLTPAVVECIALTLYVMLVTLSVEVYDRIGRQQYEWPWEAISHQ